MDIITPALLTHTDTGTAGTGGPRLVRLGLAVTPSQDGLYRGGRPSARTITPPSPSPSNASHKNQLPCRLGPRSAPWIRSPGAGRRVRG
ncbi:UNVERIFIED_CONTAM: hypothetical protein FKN15_049469 [Acipenser sinensis]